MRQDLALSRYRAVLFDVDGTLTDSLEMILAGLGDGFESYAGFRPHREFIAALMGMPLRDQMRLFSLHEPTREEIDRRVDFTLAAYLRHAHLERPFDAAIDALVHAKQTGLKIALVTSRNSTEVDHLMTHFRAADQVDTVVCASDVQRPKPDPESALLACSRLDVEPSEALFVGDSLYDLRCARGAGVDVIAVTYGAGKPELLSAEQPDLLIESPDALLEWVRTTSRQPCLDGRK